MKHKDLHLDMTLFTKKYVHTWGRVPRLQDYADQFEVAVGTIANLMTRTHFKRTQHEIIAQEFHEMRSEIFELKQDLASVQNSLEQEKQETKLHKDAYNNLLFEYEQLKKSPWTRFISFIFPS